MVIWLFGYIPNLKPVTLAFRPRYANNLQPVTCNLQPITFNL
ncbi:hypothetical protein [Moorena sp. SIO1F2]|nr:hypothetical protein [Moorena sp. SIO1F2]